MILVTANHILIMNIKVKRVDENLASRRSCDNPSELDDLVIVKNTTHIMKIDEVVDRILITM